MHGFMYGLYSYLLHCRQSELWPCCGYIIRPTADLRGRRRDGDERPDLIQRRGEEDWRAAAASDVVGFAASRWEREGRTAAEIELD